MPSGRTETPAHWASKAKALCCYYQCLSRCYYYYCLGHYYLSKELCYLQRYDWRRRKRWHSIADSQKVPPSLPPLADNGSNNNNTDAIVDRKSSCHSFCFPLTENSATAALLATLFLKSSQSRCAIRCLFGRKPSSLSVVRFFLIAAAVLVRFLFRFGANSWLLLSELFVVYDFPLIDLSFPPASFLFSTASAALADVASFHSFRLPLARLLLLAAVAGGCRSSSFLRIFS